MAFPHDFPTHSTAIMCNEATVCTNVPRDHSVFQGAIERLAAPREFFHSCYHRFLCLADSALQTPTPHEPDSGLSVYIETDPDTDRALCARAMAEVYSVHAAVIGACCPASIVLCAMRMPDQSPYA